MFGEIQALSGTNTVSSILSDVSVVLAGCVACWHPRLECVGIQDTRHMWCRYKTVLKRPLAIQKELQNNSNRDNHNKNRSQIKRFFFCFRQWATRSPGIWEWDRDALIMAEIPPHSPAPGRAALNKHTQNTEHGNKTVDKFTPCSRLSFASFYSLFVCFFFSVVSWRVSDVFLSVSTTLMRFAVSSPSDVSLKSTEECVRLMCDQ